MAKSKRKPDAYFSQHWQAAQERYREIRESGKCVIYITGEKLSIVSPYHKEFKATCYAIGGKWYPRTQRWMLRRAALDLIAQAAREAFGVNNVSVEVTK